MTNPAGPRTVGRGPVIAWALWDCGATGVNAIVVTFVYSVYLTEQVGAGLPGPTSPASWLGRVLAIAGVFVALFAPATGVLVDAPHRRRIVLAVLTGVVVVLTSAMSVIRADYHYLWLGLALLAGTAAFSDLATVPYNAMLRQLSTPNTSGRISGFGLAAGYFGSVGLLVIVYFGFIAGDGDTRGALSLPHDDGQNVRAAILVTAAWFALFALPLLITSKAIDLERRPPSVGVFGAYRALWAEVKAEWGRDHHVVYYLVASAIFRDGLTGVFTFGAVLGVTVFGVSPADVLVFGICACVIAAVGAVIGGQLDDRIGSKPVIVGSLAAMVVVGLVLLNLSGAPAFWICGLLLCLFIGPTQSSARTMMMRMSTEGKEGVAFGLYTTTGRAVSFLAPLLFFTYIDVFGTDRAGLAGLVTVLIVGLISIIGVRVPSRRR